ncbi:hypothetical protein TN889_21335 [Burkholderia gladioli pv. alliicola]|uniref:hypothetical protein n=1 Tax=Burkholderia gladioli TaxID=28095 RepID=UPI0019075EAF|nr:hypothetical protein [Burkholderia gladioli]MBJ9714632.1 hypothetical protein [Burkholderia gladioli]MDZ4038921.1 hypothetical protein [Burkholderia gladioli pv. alliicola]
MSTPIQPAVAEQILHADARDAIDAINQFTFATFKTRGGRLGSGMGTLLEAMWVYYMNHILENQGGQARECELAWLQDHEPADFACLHRGADWDPSSRSGELLRIEAKSMNIGVDEAKGHFTNLARETRRHDQLLVLIWSWASLQNGYSWPQIHDYFLGPSLPIIFARDQLHLARGGTFVGNVNCPDGCLPGNCTHIGEPLNAALKRERRSGPRACKPANVEYAANFGGLVRMLKTDSENARRIFRDLRRSDEVIHRYISFIHKHFPSEEINQYRKAEWQAVLNELNISAVNPSSADANDMLRRIVPAYQDFLRQRF